MKLFKIQGTGFYNINVTFISSQKYGLLNKSNLISDTFSVFPSFEKKMVKFLVKIL